MRRHPTELANIFHDTLDDIIMKMSQGNCGAIGVIAQLLDKNALIDPDNALGPLGAISMLNTMGVYGKEVWIFYKDICGGDIRKMILLLRAIQLGVQPLDEVYDILDDDGQVELKTSWNDLSHSVCSRLENFRGI